MWFAHEQFQITVDGFIGTDKIFTLYLPPRPKGKPNI